jgi:hypothetical protein
MLEGTDSVLGLIVGVKLVGVKSIGVNKSISVDESIGTLVNRPVSRS